MTTANYLATAELLDDEAEAEKYSGKRRRIILDAVPLTALIKWGSEDESLSEKTAPPFLLLETEATPESIRLFVDGGGWVSFALSDTDFMEGGVGVTAINFGDENIEGLQLQLINAQPATPLEISSFSILWAGIQPQAFLQGSSTEWSDYAHSVGVYDVGQGSFGAIVNEYEHPIMYLDMGWPIQFKRNSLPRLPKFQLHKGAAAEDAPVVLSHLDWDHWGYAIKQGVAKFNDELLAWVVEPVYRREAIERHWYLREPNYLRHNLGASHANFVHTLAATKTKNGQISLYYYNEKFSSIQLGPATLIRCVDTSGSKDPKFLRNNEGLAVMVLIEGRKRILVCGDADYPSIPQKYRKNLHGIVAPHHGGAITHTATPTPARPGAKMVVSVGASCYQSMPDISTKNAAIARGWNWVETTQRTTCQVSSTCSRGHKTISFGPPPKCGCNAVPNSCLCLN